MHTFPNRVTAGLHEHITYRRNPCQPRRFFRGQWRRLQQVCSTGVSPSEEKTSGPLSALLITARSLRLICGLALSQKRDLSEILRSYPKVSIAHGTASVVIDFCFILQIYIKCILNCQQLHFCSG